MKIKWLKKEKLIHPIQMLPGDTFQCKYTREYYNKATGRTIKKETYTLAEATATIEAKIDEVRIFEFKNWGNLKKGIGGLFGERKKEAK